MKSLDVFVLPSLLEGIPRCVMEAMVARIPVIASDIPGNRAIVEHGRTGLLFDPANPRELADRVASLRVNDDLRKALVSAAHAHVTDHFSNRRMAAEYQELYSRLI
jgi:glycosyltransferase involved in cell wall biosynthesis